MTKTKFKPWEVALIVFAVLMSSAAAFVLLSNRSIYPLLLGIKDTGGSNQPIGILNKEVGAVKRQPIENATFKPVHQGEKLLNEDMIITSADGSASVLLDDGGIIELGPNTMARLSIDQQLGLQGISRNASIEVVAGNVNAKTKNSSVTLKSAQGGTVTIGKNQTHQVKVDLVPIIKPKPKVQEVKAEPTVSAPATAMKPIEVPSPVAVAKPSPSPIPTATPIPEQAIAGITYPAHDAKFDIPKDAPGFSFLLNVKAEVDSDSIPLRLVVQRKTAAKPFLDKELKAVNKQIAESTPISKPGRYRVSLTRTDGKPWSKSAKRTEIEFTLNDQVEKIKLKPLRLGGHTLEDVHANQKLLKKFEIEMSWEPVPDVEEYTLILANPKTPTKVMLEKKTKDVSIVINKGQVYSGSFRYQIRAKHPNGFTLVSPWGDYQYELNAPTITEPQNGANLTAGQSTFLIWTKTNFAEAYELELYGDSALKVSLLKVRKTENFHSLKNLKPGTYYLRVRATSKAAGSAYSPVSSFTVK